jgi:hypothetical protein
MLLTAPAISRAAKFRGKKIDQSERSKLTVNGEDKILTKFSNFNFAEIIVEKIC